MITLYSTHCPQCKALQMKLDKKNIHYMLCDDKKEMERLGFTSAPVLAVTNEVTLETTYYPFASAIKWVNTQP